MKDFVKCNNCENELYVEIGEDVCPKCKFEGSLRWVFVECDVCGKEVDYQDTEDFIDESQGLKVYVCSKCTKEAEKREEYDEKILDMRLNK